MNNDILIWGDNKKICHEIKNKLCKIGVTAELSVFTEKHLDRDILQIAQTLEDEKIVLIFKNEDLKDITEKFHNQGITDVSVLPWDTHCVDDGNDMLKSCILSIDNTKPRLDYVEIEICGSCNLNCKGCFQFSNLVEGKAFCDLNSFRNDLEKLKELFWGVAKIRLLGGEPLLNPDFLQFATTAREIFPDSDIRLVSNGLLITKLSESNLQTIKNAKCTFDISAYPPTQKQIKEITDFLKKAKITHTVSLPIKMFFKRLLAEPLESPNKSFDNCIFTHCHVLGGGHLSPCSQKFYVNRLNTAFNLDYPEEKNINIYTTSLNGWQINEIFKHPNNFCRFCSQGMVPFKWETRPTSNAKADDWIIKRTFINVRVVPKIQAALKLFAKQLRHFKQQPKNQ